METLEEPHPEIEPFVNLTTEEERLFQSAFEAVIVQLNKNELNQRGN